MKTRRRILLAALIVTLSLPLLAALAYWRFHDAIDIDACLDQGGKWNYSSRSCILK